MKKKICISAAILLAILGSVFIFEWRRCDPGTYPPEWDQLSLGMTHREVEELVPDLYEAGMKGFFAHSNSGWHLNIHFGQHFIITSISKDFTCEHHGLRNRFIHTSENGTYERTWFRERDLPK